MGNMPTLRDVARLAEVSVATVSNVVNNTKHVTAETRERVERAIAETGYVPNQAARALARQKKRN
jgi:DNA-binding LacI/PurR family transcriptional regulator